MFEKLIYYFLIFFIYAVIGYFCEIISIYKNTKELTLSRGILIGPYLPIFGFGGLLYTLLLNRYTDEPVTIFLLGIVYSCILEYATSFFLERIFKLRWWDYSDKKYNINGRVCLENGIFFGIGALLVCYGTNPYIFKILTKLPVNVVYILSITLFTIMFIDFIISMYTITKLQIDYKAYLNKDATSEIKRRVKSSLSKYSFFHNRLIKAYPNIANERWFVEIKNIIKERRKKHEK